MEEVHTFDRMRTTAVLPKIAMRDMRGIWQEKGKPDSHYRAMKEAAKILSHVNPAKFSEEIDTRIRTRFKGLVTGEAGWKP
jgi:trimethylamine--corrinoid protein Co-methyltransferase